MIISCRVSGSLLLFPFIDRGYPYLVIHVESRPAPQQDVLVTPKIHQDKICNACPVVTKCTQSATGRSLSIKPQVEYEATQEARQRQELPEFKEKYHARAGIEGTLSQAVVALGMRKTRYRDPVKVHFQHLTTAAAINLKRVYAWLNETPRATTRTSAFAALAA